MSEQNIPDFDPPELNIARAQLFRAYRKAVLATASSGKIAKDPN